MNFLANGLGVIANQGPVYHVGESLTMGGDVTAWEKMKNWSNVDFPEKKMVENEKMGPTPGQYNHHLVRSPSK